MAKPWNVKWIPWNQGIGTASMRKDAPSEKTILVIFLRMSVFLALASVVLMILIQLVGQMRVRSTLDREQIAPSFAPPAMAPGPEPQRE